MWLPQQHLDSDQDTAQQKSSNAKSLKDPEWSRPRSRRGTKESEKGAIETTGEDTRKKFNQIRNCRFPSRSGDKCVTRERGRGVSLKLLAEVHLGDSVGEVSDS